MLGLIDLRNKKGREKLPALAYPAYRRQGPRLQGGVCRARSGQEKKDNCKHQRFIL
jgi:hypothetical protein